MKKLICLVFALSVMLSAGIFASADQKSTVINKTLVWVNGYMDESNYLDSGKITVDQIVKQNGESTTTANIYILYDNEYIYIFGNVNDKTRITAPPEYDWITDSVEIQLDLDCYEKGQAVGSGYTGLFRVVRYKGSVSVDEKLTSPAFLAMRDKIQCAVTDKGINGYDFEIALPHGNNFREAKLGVSCIVNDAEDGVKNLSAMVFMNSSGTGKYNNTKDFYTFTLSDFNNKRADNAPTYLTSSTPASSDPSSEEQSSDEPSSEDESGNETSEKTELPKQDDDKGTFDRSSLILYGAIAVGALIIIGATLIISVAVKKNKKNAE